MNPRKPNDFPIARGVSPPPRPFHRRPMPRAPALPRRSDTVIESRPVILRKPVVRRRNWVVEAAVVVLLAGFCMAAGWWLFHDHGGRSRPFDAAAREGEAPADQREQPARQEPRPPGARVAAEKPVQPAPPQVAPKVIEKPVEKPAIQSPPPATPRPPGTPLTFQNDIRPILQAKCALCHGDRNKLKGGLDVRTLRSLEKGGDSGPAINREQPETSPLWESISSGQMPPGKATKLSAAEKKKLHDWLAHGGR